MSVPYDYDQTNIEHLRAVVAEQEAAIEYLRECCKEREVEIIMLRELARGMYGILATFDTILGNHDACETPRPLVFGEDKSFKDVMRDLGMKVDGC